MATRALAPKLTVEQLDDRLTPVVGAFAQPAAVPAGGGLDGVVQILDLYSKPIGTGALLIGGRHVLTAAHVVDAGGTVVAFDLPGGRVVRSTSAAARHPGWTPLDKTATNDLAVLTLSTAAPSAAPRYDIYRGSDEIDKAVTLTGYGRTGVGDVGVPPPGPGQPPGPTVKRAGENRFDATARPLNDEIKVIDVTGPVLAGSFRLRLLDRDLTPPDGTVTPTIGYSAKGSSASNVQAALEAVVGRGNVAVRSPEGRPWQFYVQFRGALAGKDVGGLRVESQSWVTYPASSPGAVRVYGRVDGGQLPAPDTRLVADFDNGERNNDAFGLLYGRTGLGRGSREAITSYGDSGGPAFVDGKIAGVTSAGLSLGHLPDVRWFPALPTDPDERYEGSVANATFGEVAVYTRVSAFARWIDSFLPDPRLFAPPAGPFLGVEVDVPDRWQPEPIPGLRVQPTSLVEPTAGTTNRSIAPAVTWLAFASPESGKPVVVWANIAPEQEADDEVIVDLFPGPVSGQTVR